MQGLRDESGEINDLLVQKDIVDLYEGGIIDRNNITRNISPKFCIVSGPGSNETDDQLYIDVFTLRSFNHLNAVAIGFEQQYGASLTTVVVTEFANDMGNAMASICKIYNTLIKQPTSK